MEFIKKVKKQEMKRKVLALAIATLVASTLFMGCSEDNRIFEKESNAYELVALSQDELENNTYYVKDKTTFYATHKASGNFSNIPSKVDSSRLKYLADDLSLVPTLYKGEVIAYPTTQTSLEDITLERLKDLGWSFGITGMYTNSDGYICFDTKQNIITGSNAEGIFKTSEANLIRIATINDKPVSEDSLTSAGTVNGLEEKTTYQVNLYSGSKYGTVNLKSDVHYFQSFEIFKIDEAKDTQNGYLSISMPDDLKSGYYIINGVGMFKYLAIEKGEDESSIDMNEAYYKSEAEAVSAYSQQYFISIPETTNDIRFCVDYEESEDQEVAAYLTAPDGTVTEMYCDTGMAAVSMEQAMNGKWTINITPKDVVVNNVYVEGFETYTEGTEVDYTVVMDEGTQNVRLKVTYEGEGDVWGTVTAEDGSARVFINDTKNKCVYVDFDYMDAGTYAVALYHHTDTQLAEDIEVGDVEENLDEEVIIIQE